MKKVTIDYNTGNRKIAKYMEYEQTEGDYRDSEGYYNINGVFFRNKQLRFNVDWNWLMPVVKKVLRESYSSEIHKVYESLHNFDMNQVYISVIEYIDSLD